MWRQRALKAVLVLVGLLFSAGIYPITMILWRRDQSGYTDAMMMSLYVTLGVLLLIAVRNPSAHRSLIAFTAWSSFAHAAVMAIQAYQSPSERGNLVGVALLIVIGLPLIVLAPPNPSKHRWNKLPFRIPTVAALPASGSQWAPFELLIVAYMSTSAM